MDRPFLIAELGVNFNGSLDIAKRLISLAKKYDWDAIKFQKRTIDTVYSKEFLDSPRESPWGTTQRQQKEALEFGREEYDEIGRYCKKIDIDWFASAWDIDSQIFLDEYGLKYNKIASPMLTHLPLLEHVAKQGKKTFISTGMSSWDDIDTAVGIFRENNCPFVLMHCVGIYPCPLEKLNLNMISVLRKRYQCEIGYSGHSPGALDAVIACVLGAEYIEKHITLDRAMYGSDQSASIESAGIEFIAKHCRHIPIMRGNGEKVIWDDEQKNADKLKYWKAWKK